MSDKSNKAIFYASCLSLMSAALIFIAREHLGHILIQEENILTKVEFGNISGWAFKGTALALLLFSPLIDRFGLKKGMVVAWFFQVAGIVGFVISRDPMVMLVSMTLAGFGWGVLEATINPLCAAQQQENTSWATYNTRQDRIPWQTNILKQYSVSLQPVKARTIRPQSEYLKQSLFQQD